MNILVLGATGGTGRATVADALARGHRVTAFVRDPAAMAPAAGLEVVTGDATRPADLARTLPGHDAVIVALGERPGTFDWLPGRRARASTGVCAAGTRNLLDAMPRGAKPRIVVVSAFGLGDTRAVAPWYLRGWLWLFMPAMMADKERQEAALKASDADFVLVHPVGLTDGPATGNWLASPEGAIRSLQVARSDLAAFLVATATATDGRHARQTVAISG